MTSLGKWMQYIPFTKRITNAKYVHIPIEFKYLSSFQRLITRELVIHIASFLSIGYRAHFARCCKQTRAACADPRSFFTRLQITTTRLAPFSFQEIWSQGDPIDGLQHLMCDHEQVLVKNKTRYPYKGEDEKDLLIVWIKTKVTELVKLNVYAESLNITVPATSELEFLKLCEPLIHKERTRRLQVSLPSCSMPTTLYKQVISWTVAYQQLQHITINIWGADADQQFVIACESLCTMPHLHTCELLLARNAAYYTIGAKLAPSGFAWPKTLTSLGLSGADLSNNAMRLFEKAAPSLTRLDLTRCKMEDVRDIGRFTNLKHLSLNRVFPLTQTVPVSATRTMKRILDLVGKNLASLCIIKMSYLRFDGLRFLQSCPNLTSLCLHRMDLRRMSFKHLFALRQLRHLCLETSTVDGYTWLSASKIVSFGLDNLNSLNLFLPNNDAKYAKYSIPLERKYDFAIGTIRGMCSALRTSRLLNLYGLESLADIPFTTARDGQAMHIQDYFQDLWPNIDVALGKNLAHACPYSVISSTNRET